ncbi:PREDICTED: SPARC-like protein 1 isoform X1 [Crocodylus porosus]|uniref:SPARC-like protein 1 isoform X1 n=1 Tax=Crocodylus porosus TaxID=8502 RepID=UPI00093BF276|nr:PREDICTED: SPARC-like protein 1 isoform X1 [Crocodylus porosus]XP_019408349.1 PREDICTED: SPARC-like protein 1 isoform X1 [Crocodylus porosus]
MKTVAFFICLVGSSFAIPTYPLMYKLGIRGQKNTEKTDFRMILDNSQPTAISQKQHMEKTSAARQNVAVSMVDDPLVANKHETFIASHLSNSSPLQVQDSSSETSEKEHSEPELYLNKDSLLPLQGSHEKEEQALMVSGEPKVKHRTVKRQERSSSKHHRKSGLEGISLQHIGPTLASDIQWSDFVHTTSSKQSTSENFQLGKEKKYSNIASHQGQNGEENPAEDFTLVQEQGAWKYNKKRVAVSENNSESDEDMEEEATAEECSEIGYIDRGQKTHLTIQEDHYENKQNNDNRQSDETLRDSSQPFHITKRQDAGQEEEEKNMQAREEATVSSRITKQDQNIEWQGQKDEERLQDGNQNTTKHEEVVRRKYMEAQSIGNNNDNADNNSDAGGNTDDFNQSQKGPAYQESERIQSNDHGSISAEQQREREEEDGSVVINETDNNQHIDIKHFINVEQDYYSHEPANSDSEEHAKIASLLQNANTMESEDNVKTTDSSHNKRESTSDSSMKVLLFDPCRNFHCKRGKVCHADEQGKLSCVCQDPAACPPTKDYEHICGTDNKTYEGICQLFGMKCQLEGTKMGHQLHLDYIGSCKYIPPCTDYEADQFPLRMRDWLKNILIQYYEHYLDRSGFLSDKQQNKVQKIYQNEKRLMAGDHPIELLLHDFEKNYHMYVYPVHWQFHQLDQHPVDRLLTHSELAPLRASLVPMEYCVTRFFQECDADKDKHVCLKEWCHCFGIKEEDIDENLLF